MEFLIRDRLSWLRFLGFRIGEATPDAKTIWLFREKLVRPGPSRRSSPPSRSGYAPAGGQIVDATLVSAPRQRMTGEEKDRAKAGESACEIWPGKLARETGQGGAEGHRRALGVPVFQGEKGRKEQG